MRTPKQSVWLISGIGLIAGITGYMVGGSQTPVVSVAIPAIFGLVVTGLGFIGNSNLEKKLEPIKELLEKNEVTHAESAISFIKNDIQTNPDRIGKILITFSLFYIIGLAFGTYARITNLYALPQNRQLPWEQDSNYQPPSTISNAIDWINLQEELISLGYSQRQINKLYVIQISEWEKQKQVQNPINPPIPQPKETPKSDNEKPSSKLSGRIKKTKVFSERPLANIPPKPSPVPFATPELTPTPVLTPTPLKPMTTPTPKRP